VNSWPATFTGSQASGWEPYPGPSSSGTSNERDIKPNTNLISLKPSVNGPTETLDLSSDDDITEVNDAGQAVERQRTNFMFSSDALSDDLKEALERNLKKLQNLE
jgi:hypothetical protein